MQHTLDVGPELMLAEWSLLRLSNLYARAMDRNEPAILDLIFTPDAALQGAWFDMQGIENIRAMPGALHAKYASMMHVVHNQTVEVQGERAEGETYCLAHHLDTRGDRGGPMLFVMGLRYQNRWVMQDGVWKFAHRRIDLEWTETRGVWRTINAAS